MTEKQTYEEFESEDECALDDDGNIAWEVYNGGRCLNAVQFSYLPPPQRSILIAITSKMNFKGRYNERRWMSVRLIARLSGYSMRHVTKIISELVSNGYIIRDPRIIDGKQCANYYKVTNKIFHEYEAYLAKRRQAKIERANSYSCDTKKTQIPPVKISGVPPIRYQGGGAKISGLINPSLAPSEIAPSISFSAGAKKLKKPKSAVVSNKTSKAPQKAPPRAPNSAGVQTDRLARRKAIEAFSMMFKPTDLASDGKPRFYDANAVRATAELAYERYGLGAVLAFRDEFVTSGTLGRLPFDANLVLQACAKKTQ